MRDYVSWISMTQIKKISYTNMDKQGSRSQESAAKPQKVRSNPVCPIKRHHTQPSNRNAVHAAGPAGGPDRHVRHGAVLRAVNYRRTIFHSFKSEWA
jgi:hypothetical protein